MKFRLHYNNKTSEMFQDKTEVGSEEIDLRCLGRIFPTAGRLQQL